MKDWIYLVEQIRLQGQEAVEFIREQQQMAPDEWQEETSRRREEAELRRGEEERVAELRREEAELGREEAELRRGEEERVADRRRDEAELRRGEEERPAEFRREEREHALEVARRNIVARRDEADGKMNAKRPHGKIPKLPAFVDRKYDLDCYLQRLERFTRTDNLEQDTCALSALLPGHTQE